MRTAPHIIILAAGQGKRMHSNLPKVLHPVLFRPMLHYVLDLALSIPHATISVVVGHGKDEVIEQCKEYSGIHFVTQPQQCGTAHAVKMATPGLKNEKGMVLILSGDVILLKASSLEKLVAKHSEAQSPCSLFTAKLTNPTGYGRILRHKDGKVFGIREELDCNESQRGINEINCGIYCFDIPQLLSALDRISDKNAQKEFYLPDVVGVIAAENQKLVTVSFEDPLETIGINDRYALWHVETILQERTNREWMLKGVTFSDPRTTWIDPKCKIAADVRIEAGVQMIQSSVGAGSVIESGSRISHCEIGERVHLKQGSYLEKSIVGNSCVIGPYAHLRPGTRVESEVKLGNFVEVKNSILHSGVKASHLSYIGDADIGKNVNLGCGFITCNYDGSPEKHKTVIEDNVFVGSDSQTVAPVRIGKGSYVASGTTVTEDIPPDSLALSRGRQVTKTGYAKKYRSKKEGA